MNDREAKERLDGMVEAIREQGAAMERTKTRELMIEAVIATVVDHGCSKSPEDDGEHNGNRAYAIRIVDRILGAP